MNTNTAIPAQSSRGATSSLVGKVLQSHPGLGFHISIDGPKWRDDVDPPMMEIRTEAFRTNHQSPWWRMYTDEHQKRLDNDALIAADEISLDLEKSLREHVAKHRKTWKQGQTDVLTEAVESPPCRQHRPIQRKAQQGLLECSHSNWYEDILPRRNIYSRHSASSCYDFNKKTTLAFGISLRVRIDDGPGSGALFFEVIFGGFVVRDTVRRRGSGGYPGIAIKHYWRYD
jgi:hypothetical protein